MLGGCTGCRDGLRGPLTGSFEVCIDSDDDDDDYVSSDSSSDEVDQERNKKFDICRYT